MPLKTVGRRLLKMWRTEYEGKKKRAGDLLRIIDPGSCVYVESGCGEPQHLVKHLILENDKLCDVQVYTSMPLRSYADFGGNCGSRFRLQSFFISPAMTSAFSEGNADHLPLSSLGMHKLFSEGHVRINTAVIQLSPPDARGNMSLGVMVDITRSIIEKADVVIAQVNRFMPVTRGDTVIGLDDVDFIVEHDEELVSFSLEDPDPETVMVGRNIARLIEDGSTIQVGFGRIPDAAMICLKDKQDLSIHSEIITDTIVELAASGAIACSPRESDRKRITASLCIGSRRTFDFVHDNPMVELRDITHVGDPSRILSHERFTAINGAVEIDLTGQSCVGMGEHMGYFGALGHAAFNRTAMYAPGGKGIIALRSTSRDGRHSRIVPDFTERKIGVITTQADINYVVTEYGSVNLFGKSIRERALSLITIAHPRFRQWLLDEAKRMKYVYEDQIIPPEYSLYPASHEHIHAFGKAKCLVRPIKITDERAVQNLFYSLSQGDRFHRFLMQVSTLHHKQAQVLVSADYRNVMGLIVEDCSGTHNRVIAAAQVAPEEDEGGKRVCEFAAMVDPAWQNRGICTYLLESLMHIGRDLGFDLMCAYVWKDNLPMLKVFEKACCTMTHDLDCNVYRVCIGI